MQGKDRISREEHERDSTSFQGSSESNHIRELFGTYVTIHLRSQYKIIIVTNSADGQIPTRYDWHCQGRRDGTNASYAGAEQFRVGNKSASYYYPMRKLDVLAKHTMSK
jgi:hypothetical protein